MIRRLFQNRALALALLVGIVAAPAAADIAATIFNVTRSTTSAAALSAADPTGTTNGTGGYSIAPSTANGLATRIWCELEGTSGNVTGGTVRLWMLEATGATWGVVDADKTVTNFAKGHWIGPSFTVTAGPGARFYCQTVSVTVSAGTTVDVIHGIRWEKR